MKIIKVYKTSNANYNKHLYLTETNTLWLLDTYNSLYCIPIDNEQSIKEIKKHKEISKAVVSIPSLVFPKECEVTIKILSIDKDKLIVIFKNAVHVVEDHKIDQRVKGRPVNIKGLEGNIINGSIINKSIVFVSNICKVYYIALSDLTNPSVYQLDSEKVVELRGYKSIALEHIVEFVAQDTLIALPKQSQTFYTWKLNQASEGVVEGIVEEPWKRLESTQLRVNGYNPHLSQTALNVLEEDEVITCNLIFTHIELKSPLYIVSTTKGNVYLFHILMINPAVSFPVLKIELSKRLAISHLYIKWEKLLVTSVDGLVSIVNISPKKLQNAYSEFFSKSATTFSDSIHLHLYQNAIISTGMISSGVRKFLEVRSISRLEVQTNKSRINNTVVCEESIGIVSNNNNIFILSLSKLKIIYTYRGLDSKPIGLYLNECTNSLVIITKNCTSYIYDLATCTLERKNEPMRTYYILGLEEKVVLLKEGYGYEDVFKMYNESEILKKGCNKTNDFRYFMNSVQTNWIEPINNKKIACNMLYNKFIGIDKEEHIKAFNFMVNFESKVKGKHEASPEIGFSSLRIKLGRRNNSQPFKDINKCNTIVIDLQNFLSKLQKNYIAQYQRTSKKRLKFDDSLSPSEPYKSKSNIFWPFPLLSLVFCFGVNKTVDDDLEDELCTCPSILQLWPGLPGIENTFSFIIPSDEDSSKGYFKWKQSPYLNTIYSALMFSSLNAIINFNEELISSLINRLLGVVPQLISSKGFPYVSFIKLGELMLSSDPDIWSTSRDIILKPFLFEARSEVFLRLNTQIFNFIETLYAKVKKNENYKKSSKLVKDNKSLVRFKKFAIINTLFGPVEIIVLTVLCYIIDIRKDIPPKVLKHCIKLICFLISYINI